MRCDRNAGLMLLQNPDDLLFRKAIALHALVLVLGQNELHTGLSPRGKVTRNDAAGQKQNSLTNKNTTNTEARKRPTVAYRLSKKT